MNNENASHGEVCGSRDIDQPREKPHSAPVSQNDEPGFLERVFGGRSASQEDKDAGNQIGLG